MGGGSAPEIATALVFPHCGPLNHHCKASHPGVWGFAVAEFGPRAT